MREYHSQKAGWVWGFAQIMGILAFLEVLAFERLSAPQQPTGRAGTELCCSPEREDTLEMVTGLMSSGTSRTPSTESLFSHLQMLPWHETHLPLGIPRSTSDGTMKCSQSVHHGTALRGSTQYPAKTITHGASQYIWFETIVLLLVSSPNRSFQASFWVLQWEQQLSQHQLGDGNSIERSTLALTPKRCELGGTKRLNKEVGNEEFLFLNFLIFDAFIIGIAISAHPTRSSHLCLACAVNSSAIVWIKSILIIQASNAHSMDFWRGFFVC